MTDLPTSGTNSLKKLFWKIWDHPSVNRLGARLLRPLCYLGLPLDHLHYKGIIRLPLPDGRTVKLRSYGDDYMLNRVFWKNHYEPETTAVFYRLAKHSQCTLDVGAHVGIYTLLAARANPNARVFAFEPFPRIHARLVENVDLNGLRNVTCSTDALGNRQGTAQFYFVPSAYITSNSTLRESAPSQGIRGSISIDVTTLESVVERNKMERVDLIKMDTEGTELDVLRGMGNVLGRDKPSIICEVLDGLADCQALEQLLSPLGYSYYVLEPGKPRKVARITPQKPWRNYLFTHLTPDHWSAP